jgi:hypothetical protein
MRRSGFATFDPDVRDVPNARRRTGMTTLRKSLKLAGALTIALGAAAPLMATPASAAPHRGHAQSHHVQYNAMRDHRHTPKPRFERRPPMPHGHYKWQQGRWNWSRDHWVWAPGIWIRF